MYTPGPWCLYDPFIDGDTEEYGTAPFIHEGGDVLAVMNCTGPYDSSSRENGTLMAAAPDLLKALEASLQYIVLAYHDSKERGLADKTLQIAQRDFDEARAAIAKAKGEAG